MKIFENGRRSPDRPAVRPEAVDLHGAALYPGYLGPDEQAALVDDLRSVVAAAPLFAPVTPWGGPMSVRMTSAGRYGWVTDRRGYRYDDRHPAGGGHRQHGRRAHRAARPFPLPSSSPAAGPGNPGLRAQPRLHASSPVPLGADAGAAAPGRLLQPRT